MRQTTAGSAGDSFATDCALFFRRPCQFACENSPKFVAETGKKLGEIFKENIKESADFGHDSDDDGQLSSSESESESESELD